MIEHLLRDLKHALRGVGRNPGFAMAVVMTLAFGIGTNTAIFSVADQALLRPLPYPDDEQLVAIYESGFGETRANVSPANWLDWQRQARSFQSLAAWNTAAATLTGASEAEALNGQVVSVEFFPLLGVAPLVGRGVSEEDDRPNASPVAVISHSLWHRRFGGDPSVIGRLILLNEVPTEVVGVMPPGFHFLRHDVDYWSAYRLDRSRAWRDTAGRFINIVGRLQPHVAVDVAQAEMDVTARALASAYPAFNKGTSVTLVPLREELTGRVRTSLLVLYAAVGVLLAIACLNVGNLLLARSSSRRREMAIRTAIGAGRLAIVRQLLVESLLLAAIGGVLGILVAQWSVAALVAYTPPDLLQIGELAVDVRMLVYTLTLSLLTGVIVGLVPAMSASRRPFADGLRLGSSNPPHAPKLRQALVVGQVAMTVVLLCGAGLLMRTVIALNSTYPGFDRRDVLTFQLGLPGARYDEEQRIAFVRHATDALRQLPGVESAGAANSLPVTGSPRGGTVFHIHGQPELPLMERPITIVRVVTPEYFQTLGIPILRGRDFTDADQAVDAAPVFIVNQAFASRFLADADPLTASMSVLMRQDNPYGQVIGIVGDVKEGSLRDSSRPTVFYNHGQMPEATMAFFIRASHASGLDHAAVGAIRALDGNLAVRRVQTIETAMGASVARERLSAILSGAFALSGLFLASLGLYGLLAFLVAERTKEIGIRIALGAQLGRVLRSVMGGGLRLVAFGTVIGLCGAVALSRVMVSLLYSVSPYDPLTYAAVLALLGAVGAVAAFVPGRRATRIEPLIALRQE